MTLTSQKNAFPRRFRNKFVSFLLIFILNLIFLSACNKKDTQAKPPGSASDVSKYALSDQRVIYNLFSAEEKAIQWKKHISEIIAISSRLRLSAEQDAFLRLVKGSIMPVIFEEHIPAVAQHELDMLKVKSKAIFPNKKMAFFIFNTLMDFETFANLTRTDQGTTAELDDKKGCSCSTESDYCYGFSECISENDCLDNKISCGFLWRYLCDGTCK